MVLPCTGPPPSNVEFAALIPTLQEVGSVYFKLRDVTLNDFNPVGYAIHNDLLFRFEHSRSPTRGEVLRLPVTRADRGVLEAGRRTINIP